MHPSLLLLSLTLVLPLSAGASSAPPPPPHQSHLTKHRVHFGKPTRAPQEYFEVTRPLPFQSHIPSCTLPILSHAFGNTTGLPPINTTYSAPLNCTWSRVALHLSGESNGSQYDRIAGVWLSGVELLRTSTPEPTPDGIFWNVRKDVTRYSSLLRQSNLTLSVMLENVINDVYTGVYRLNLTLLYYDVATDDATSGVFNFFLSLFRPNERSASRKLKDGPVPLNLKNSLELNENPADLVVPISATGDDGFWFKIESDLDAAYKGIQIPLNTYRAVIEVYVSFHGDDEYWYSNPPDYYIEMNGLPTKRGHGAYRELLVKLDDKVVGSVIPFPVIFSGGINPLLWERIASIGAFDLPSYEFELTPFLGLLLDGKVHDFGLGVADAISFWLVNANLHLWLDDKAGQVQAGAIKHRNPGSQIERESKYEQLDGKFEIEGKSESEFLGWVNCSAGNFTSSVWRKLVFENKIKYKDEGTGKEVKQEVKMKSKVRVKSDRGKTISSMEVERKYPLKMVTSRHPTEDDTYLVSTRVEHSLKEEKDEDGQFASKLENSQEAYGHMFVQDHDVLSGAATTSQDYDVEDYSGCYTRLVKATNGFIRKDTEKFLCEEAAY